jgi:hypothetical protein
VANVTENTRGEYNILTVSAVRQRIQEHNGVVASYASAGQNDGNFRLDVVENAAVLKGIHPLSRSIKDHYEFQVFIVCIQ